MLGIVATPSPALFFALPVLVSIPFAVWKDKVGGILPAAALAAGAATLLYVAFLIATLGYSPTGSSIAAAFTLVQYALICLAAVAAISWLWRGIRRGR